MKKVFLLSAFCAMLSLAVAAQGSYDQIVFSVQSKPAYLSRTGYHMIPQTTVPINTMLSALGVDTLQYKLYEQLPVQYVSFQAETLELYQVQVDTVRYTNEPPLVEIEASVITNVAYRNATLREVLEVLYYKKKYNLPIDFPTTYLFEDLAVYTPHGVQTMRLVLTGKIVSFIPKDQNKKYYPYDRVLLVQRKRT